MVDLAQKAIAQVQPFVQTLEKHKVFQQKIAL